MKYVKYSFCIVFILILFFFFFTTIDNNQGISNLEKRTLQTFPKISISTIIDGSYMEDVTLAFSDQLEFRDYLVKGYYLFQFQRYNGDVVIGDNNELYAAYQRVGNIEKVKEEVKNLTFLINNISSEIDAQFIFLSIPRKDAVEKTNLPESYISSEYVYKESINKIKENLSSDIYLIDGYEVFNNDNHNNRYYYMQDHHITPRGAELLYKKIINIIDDEKVLTYDLSNYVIGNTIINGSFNNQLGQSVKPTSEELYLIPKYNLRYVRYEDEKISNLKVFDVANTYEDAYMKGDHAYTIIDTNRDDLPSILYVGSSFTNILEAMSIPSFDKVISIDYRHNTSGNSIKYYVDKYDIDYVVFIPSQSNNAFSSSMIKTHLGLNY